MKRIVSMMVIFTLLLGGMTHVQAQTSKAAEKGLLGEECSMMLKEFFKELREKRKKKKG